MTGEFYIAWQYIRNNKAKAGVLVALVTLILFLPVSLQILLEESRRQLNRRAATTPLIVGAEGSALDLVMNTIYFGDDAPEAVTMQACEQVEQTALAVGIPVHIRFRTRGLAVVGTIGEYFDLRKLRIGQGRLFMMPGECVLGAGAARHLDLWPGNDLVSPPRNLFERSGKVGSKMKVVGVLEESGTCDDLGVFVDLPTVWIMEGLEHEHKDVAGETLCKCAEITDDNRDSFLFGDDLSAYPITAVIAVPKDNRSAAVLRGRYLSGDSVGCIIEPMEVVDGLLANIFGVKNMLDGVIALVGGSMTVAVVLVFALSLWLRQGEIDTIFRLGCSRMAVVRLLAAEICIIVIISGVLCWGMVYLVGMYKGRLIGALFG